MEKEKNEVITQDEAMIDSLVGERKTQYTSLAPTNDNDRMTLFNAMTNPSFKLADKINEVISLTHVFCEIVDIIDNETGEPRKLPRIVLIDDKNESYECVSLGVFNAIKKLFSIMGTPDTWEKPLKVKILQQKRGTRNMLTLSLMK